ncbi:MAG TPA: glycerol-3-phosphate dehydrogenase C-terminal domain-containing protein, partial [Bryobacteraceae bacterium]|nr:glycerol-3-phosphate dehydrogenase C-terminal domain-containing protein [Bryobacteraceae bacterium]
RPERLTAALPYTEAEVLWAVRHEMARTIEDVLARRTRALFLNARASIESAGRVAAIMGEEVGWDAGRRQREVERFTGTAANYVCS